MSAIARMLKEQGAKISGSDMSESDVTRGLQNLGVVVNFNQVAENLGDETVANAIDCVVYTTAIGGDNPEFIEAQKRGLPIFKYAEMLGQISSEFETVAVSGTHGKTTTTAMIASAFHGDEQKPHVIVGSLLPEYKSNYIKGDSDKKGGNILVTEVCEYKRSFLNLNPKHVVITNIEEDHLDYYSDLADIQSAFVSLCEKLPEDGKIICNPDHQNLKPIVEKFGKGDAGDESNNGKSGSGKIIDYKDFLNQVPELKVLGEHNRINAAATIALMSIFSDDVKGPVSGLKEFKGTWRRLEARGKSENGAVLYDDYAHHPDEVLAGIKALHGAFPDKKLCVFFQPHLYSRTKILFDDFIKVFSETDQNGRKYIDELYLLPIYAARESADPEISSEILAEKTGATFVESFEKAAEIASAKSDDSVVVTMGAGDVYHILDLVV